ncbi:helix-turn-helix domain-containing protein [Pseudomonas sp. NPDC007930]|uniref:AraC family transcriptional regulator n=1 Tax=Pseudomonas sp. NPDC007930 TaxID=3364417 RepID=UPI0036DFC0DE
MTHSDAVSPSAERWRDSALFGAHNLLFLHSDQEAVCSGVGRVFKPHQLAPARRGEGVSASMHNVSRGRLSVSRLEYGSDVHIDPGRLERFYLVQVPLRGSAQIGFGDCHFESSPQLASLISPQQPLRMRWQGAAPQLALRLDAEDVAEHCRQHLAEARLPEFDPRLDLTQPGGAYFVQLLQLLLEAIAQPAHPLHQPLVLKQFESALLNALLYGQPHLASAKLAQAPQRGASPWFVKRSEEYIRAHLGQPLSVEMLAEQAGVSVRTLFAGFRNFRDTTPMAYLRDLRLEQVHRELRENEQASVTDVAFKWGFAHLGRFAQEYKRRFGELPSATRRFRQP